MPRDNIGFTFIELLLVLIFLSTLITLGSFSLKKNHDKNELRHVEKKLSDILYFARYQGISNNQPLVLNPTYPNQGWSKGVVLLKNNKPLKKWNFSDTNVLIEWTGFLSTNYLLFSSDLNKAACSGHFKLTLGQLPPRYIIVNRLGRVRVNEQMDSLS